MDETLKNLERTLCERLIELENKNTLLEKTVKRLSINNMNCKESLAACYSHLTGEKLKSVHPRFYENYDSSKPIDVKVLKYSIKSNLE